MTRPKAPATYGRPPAQEDAPEVAGARAHESEGEPESPSPGRAFFCHREAIVSAA